MNQFFQALINLLQRCSPIYIIDQDRVGVLLWCGRYQKDLNPGIYFVLPFFHDTTTIPSNGQLPDIRAGSALTSDGKELTVGAAISYKVLHARKAILDVEDYDKSLETLVVGEINHYVNGHSLQDCIQIQNILDGVKEKIRNRATTKWGLTILGMWITDISLKPILRVHSQSSEKVVALEEE